MNSKCSICGDFKDREWAFQKYYGIYNTYLPMNIKHLLLIKDLKPGSSTSRLKNLQQCPECKTYYLYETDYEYFAGGTEDEQTLTRLTEAEAMELLNNLSK
mgnify:CR=1 FL=1